MTQQETGTTDYPEPEPVWPDWEGLTYGDDDEFQALVIADTGRVRLTVQAGTKGVLIALDPDQARDLAETLQAAADAADEAAS